MKLIRFVRSGAGLLSIGLVIALGYSGNTLAFTAGCWADFYEFSNYIGPIIRIEGPATLPNLRKVQSTNWESRIDSMVVGPNARVWLYEHANFKLMLTEMSKYPELMNSLGISEKEVKEESELIFSPNEKIHHLGEYNFHKKAKSIKIECTK